jgi:hypothetical protein
MGKFSNRKLICRNSLDHFLKIKAVTLSSTQGPNKTVKAPPTKTEFPPRRTQRIPPQKKMNFLDSSFDKYTDKQEKVYFGVHAKSRTRRSFSGSKSKGFGMNQPSKLNLIDVVGMQVMSDVEDDSTTTRGYYSIILLKL